MPGSVSFVAGALPINQFADGRTCARNWLLISLNFRPGSFFAHRANAEPDLLIFRAHLDDLEVVFEARLKMHRLAVTIHSFRLVAQPFHAVRDLHERSESGHAKNFAMNHVADV